MANLVCIDSMICVWGIKKKATQGQEFMVAKTEAFLKSLDAQNTKIIIPAPVITEILCPVDISQRAGLMSSITKHFMIAPLDTMAAIKAGEIWNENKDSWKEIYGSSEEEGLRNRFKYDILIAGIAITRNVYCLYSNDARLRGICSKHIDTQSLPDIAVQRELF
ncbi:hypothetical protein KK083_15310 [Fulvivirgaceae bacterium PWU4]|uniref:PIN domain-containing protein n=1 Tax=Chryseosolibacter histidini TaxID=2782349 RepID=A0AAP2GPS7_9BACT|nr:hypothetical protein [Chryseosolibacter histidini]MBT1698260.1 hypothetical protein [Chryseosolibacter histidini]